MAERSAQSAQRIVEEILDRVKQIEEFPESGGHQETIKNTVREYRYLVEGNYKIIYSSLLDQHVVYIETIFDIRSNPEKLRI